MGRTTVICCGLYRSGTTFGQALIDLNLKHAAGVHMPYKHSCRPADMSRFTDDFATVIVHKPPGKWIDSIARRSFDLIEWHDLHLRPGETEIEIRYDDDRRPMPEDRRPLIPVSLERLVDVYISYFRHWMYEAQRRRVIFVSHHDIAFHPEETLERISKLVNVPRRRFQRYVGLPENQRPFSKSVAETYRRRRWYEFVSPDHLAVIDGRVTGDILAFLGYLEGKTDDNKA